jgi:hypothetical protein
VSSRLRLRRVVQLRRFARARFPRLSLRLARERQCDKRQFDQSISRHLKSGGTAWTPDVDPSLSIPVADHFAANDSIHLDRLTWRGLRHVHCAPLQRFPIASQSDFWEAISTVTSLNNLKYID